MDVDHRQPEPLEELAAEDLHVARQDHDVAALTQQLQHARLSLGLAFLADGHMGVREPEGLHVGPQVVPVRDHLNHVRVQLVAAPAPQQLKHAVILA